MIEPTRLRMVIAEVLGKHGIDNLPMEMELTTAICNAFNKKLAVSKVTIVKAINAGATNFAISQDVIRVLREKLHLNPSGRDADSFIQHAVNRSKHGESIEVFATWWLAKMPDPAYWSYRKMTMLWEHAFAGRHITPTPLTTSKWDGEFTPIKDEDEH